MWDRACYWQLSLNLFVNDPVDRARRPRLFGRPSWYRAPLYQLLYTLAAALQ